MARAWDGGATPVYFESVVVAGDDIYIWNRMNEADPVDEDMDEIQQRTHQTFGQGTTAILRKLSVGVVGVSGTGSPLVEMLFRLGVGSLVLVDADTIEKKNLGRIYNSSRRDIGIYKVDVIARAIKQSGLNTKVLPIHTDLYHTSAIAALAQCDMVFGCMDSIVGRDLLNKLAVYYSLPYWDVGVGIEADGNGGVEFVGVSVHYLTPDGPTLLERKAYTSEQLRASHLKRTDPEEYEGLLDEGYIQGIREERPAVISVNTLAASLAVNDFLARIHGFRWFRNADCSAGRFNLSDAYFRYEPAPNVKSSLAPYVGRGDTVPPLGEMNVVQ
ncbi:ThiF family adenylyltransferase [Sulfobacillus thermotolerans]|uniref:ThiF family adenylyltransferase n=1 Tax=Sulfobacillus thermotolerans TaxID=338644 RepID=UPI003366D3AD